MKKVLRKAPRAVTSIVPQRRGGTLQSTVAVWDFFVQSGNIRVQDYDRGLIAALKKALDIPEDEDDLRKVIKKRKISAERFIVALLGAIEPFALMMTELCEFLERHQIRKTNQNLAIRFDFEKVNDELIFDLRHFREWLQIWEQFHETVEIFHWDMGEMWKIFSILKESIFPNKRPAEILPHNPVALRWVYENSYRERDRTLGHWSPPPAPPVLGVPDVDLWVDRVHRTISEIASACAPYDNYMALDREGQSLPSTDGPGWHGQPAPIRRWHPRSLWLLESDYFTGSVMAMLWGWVESLLGLDATTISNRAQPVIGQLKELFSSIPSNKVDQKVQKQRLEAFLNLPVWKQRHALYQAWILPAIEKALPQHPVEIYDDNGTLTFRFSETRLASFTTRDGPVSLLAEHRTPLEQPLGKGRKSNIQPDYVLVAEPGRLPEQTLVVIEAKQYLHPNLKGFGDALTDYAHGHPRAKVVLADYGPISSTMNGRVPPTLQHRTVAIGDLRPRSNTALRRFRAEISEMIPPPPIDSTDDACPGPIKYIVVDVSGSMGGALTDPSVVDTLRHLASQYPSAFWLAVDDRVRHESSGPDALGQILELIKDGGTDLPEALTGRSLDEGIVITDHDGKSQLERKGIKPSKFGVVSGAKIEWTL